MSHLLPAAKTAIIQQAINSGTAKTSEIAAANNIPKSTLNRWIRGYKQGKVPRGKETPPTSNKPETPFSAAEKVDHILASNGLSDVDLGTYCRQHGLYSYQLEDWKNELKSPQKTDNKSAALKAELTELKAQNKQLERDLRRKDKALAEASALLILKKKAALIWGESEED